MKKIFISTISLISAFILVGFVGFYLGSKFGHRMPKNLFKIGIVRAGQKGLINPLLDYEMSQNIYRKELKNFKDKVQNLINQEKQNGNVTDVGVYFRDMQDGPWFGINENENFAPASLLKVPIMITYFHLAEKDPSILTKKITFDENLKKQIPENIIPFYKPDQSIQLGYTYTVDELIKYMIVYSDNDAKSILMLNLPNIQTFYEVLKELGVDISQNADPSMSIISPHTYTTFFRVLYNASYLNDDNSQKALRFLVDADFPPGLMAGVPNNIEVADKYAERSIKNEKQLHDCGIIYLPNNPYLLCVMTKGNDFAKQSLVLKDISAVVWNEVNAQLHKSSK